MEDREYVEVKERAADRLLAIPGVHAVGVGDKLTGGERTDETSIRVYVTDKRPLEDIPPEERVPAEIEGVKTDVVEMPIPTIEQTPGIPAGIEREDSDEYRPVRGGTQLSPNVGSGSGTLGCLLTVTGDTRVIAMTNHHVVTGACTDTASGKVGQADGTSSSSDSCDDIIGTVLDTQCDVDVDVALIRLNGGTRWLAQIEEIGVVGGQGPPAVKNDQVRKRGRTTGLTGGFVDDPSIGGTVNNHDGTPYRTYAGAMRILPNPDPAHPGPTRWSGPGDSGSAVVNTAGQVVGLHFGGGAGGGLVIPIQTVIDKFATGVPAARRIQLQVASATALDDVRVVPMAADEQPAPAAITPGEARRLEEEVRSASPRGAWYADLYRRHGAEVATLVHKNRRVTVVWHRSGAAELAQWLVRAFSIHDVRVPGEIQGRPVRACVDDLGAALVRSGSSALRADLGKALPTLPDVAGLTDREILDRLRLETG
jgi:hypothetical protein